MSKIKHLMKELNLTDEQIELTTKKIEDVCRNYKTKPSRHFAFKMSGNGNGNGNGDGDN